MSDTFLTILYPVLGYLAGTIPTGLLIGLSLGVDIRTRGSGNIGATNVARVIGKKWGIITLVADMLKGFLPVLAARLGCDGLPNPQAIAALTGLAAVAGHCFSIFLRFKGGKGVATAVGVFLASCPLSVAGAFLVFFAAMKKWGIVSVASLLSAVIVPVLIHLVCPGMEQELMGWAIAGVIWFKHRDNIKRLLAGTEKSFREKE